METCLELTLDGLLEMVLYHFEIRMVVNVVPTLKSNVQKWHRFVISNFEGEEVGSSPYVTTPFSRGGRPYEIERGISIENEFEPTTPEKGSTRQPVNHTVDHRHPRSEPGCSSPLGHRAGAPHLFPVRGRVSRAAPRRFPSSPLRPHRKGSHAPVVWTTTGA